MKVQDQNQIKPNTQSCQTSVTGSAGGFLKKVVDKLFVYDTPPKILEYVEKHKFDCLIQNPPYEFRN